MAGTIVQYAGYTISFLFAVATVITTIMQKKSNSKRIEIAGKIADKIRSFMKEAEMFTAYSAGEKLNFVVTRIIQYCKDEKISYDELAVIEQIEKEIELSKTVNAKESKNGTNTNQPTARTDIK